MWKLAFPVGLVLKVMVGIVKWFVAVVAPVCLALPGGDVQVPDRPSLSVQVPLILPSGAIVPTASWVYPGRAHKCSLIHFRSYFSNEAFSEP